MIHKRKLSDLDNGTLFIFNNVLYEKRKEIYNEHKIISGILCYSIAYQFEEHYCTIDKVPTDFVEYAEVLVFFNMHG